MPNDEKYQVIEREYVLNEKIDSTPEVLVIRLKSEDGKPWPFDPGMFMMISGVDKEGKKHIARAFSIASDPSAPEIEFFIVKEPRHPKVVGQPAAASAAQAAPARNPQATAPAAESATEPANRFPEPQYTHFMNANIGDAFVLKGPSGQFRFDPAKDNKVLFIAGGTGLAPFMSMLRHLKVIGSKIDVKMMYSIKYPTEVILREEMERLVKDLNIGMTITVTRPQPGDGWTGVTGHIAENMMRECVVDVPQRMCYICGPLAFVKAVKDALMHCGVDEKRISADVWG